MPVDGGEEHLVVPSFFGSRFRFQSYFLVDKGIYFRPDNLTYQFLPFAAESAVTVFPELRPEQVKGFIPHAVSPDGRWMLLSKWSRAESDLMLVENFR